MDNIEQFTLLGPPNTNEAFFELIELADKNEKNGNGFIAIRLWQLVSETALKKVKELSDDSDDDI